MNHEEIVKEVKMTYYELQDYLLEKYGPAKYDYFTKPECKYKKGMQSFRWYAFFLAFSSFLQSANF